ncbi:RDD family protein [Conyzicola nivalis]|uniref:RDD family protein n=1 Tax=Conyzicola nivalis TaxID=1477021 RepID=A0A916WH33_9MICO|nr:RDD family protein [Conyzicola nivalis]GGA97103.1 RDD family protein [Conyzicola nivalis]
MPTQSSPATDWPGKRLGLPQQGPRSIARAPRRLIAVALDWAIATTISVVFFTSGETVLERLGASNPTATLIAFALLQVLFIPTLGGSLGHLALGMRVVPLNSGWIGVLKPVIRTALLCLFIPAVIWDRDQRGMHDRLAGTVLVRR